MDSISTGEAARMLMVTRDAVLKWIKQGKLPSYQTPGGHHRIPVDFVRSLIPTIEGFRPTGYAEKSKDTKYCWEYHAAGGKLKDECRSCLVFKVKGTKCYEIAEFLKKADAGASCCPTGCEDCSFYKEQMKRSLKVVLITNSQPLANALRAKSHNSLVNLKITGWEYETGFLLNSFRPQFVVIDLADECDLEKCMRLCEHLHQTPGNEHLRIILALSREALWFKSVGTKFPVIFKPFELSELEEYITKGMQRTSAAETSVVAGWQNCQE